MSYKLLIKLCYFIFSLFLLISCSENPSSKISKNDVNSTSESVKYVKNLSLKIEPNTSSNLNIEGRNSDTIELRFSSNTLSHLDIDPIDLNITLEYSGNSLVGFSANQDISFIEPLKIAFNLESYKKAGKTPRLKYINPKGENYYLPYEVEGDIYVYEFIHFSEYVFENDTSIADDEDVLFQSILDKITQLNAQEDKTGGIVSIRDELHALLGEISNLTNSSDASTLLSEFNEMQRNYIESFIDNKKFNEPLLIHNCMNPKLQTYIDELYLNAQLLEDTSTFNTEIKQLMDSVVSNAINNKPKQLCQETDGISNYYQCNDQIVRKAYNIAVAKEDLAQLQTHVEEQIANAAVEGTNDGCGLKCIEDALEIPYTDESYKTRLLDAKKSTKDNCSITLTVGTITPTTVSLLWASTDEISSTYNLYYALDSFKSLASLTDYKTLNGATKIRTNNTNLKLTGLTEEKTYFFKVQSLDENEQEVATSNEKSATTILSAQEDDNNFQTILNISDDTYHLQTVSKFTKIARDGSELSIQDASWSDQGSEEKGTRWSCVRDNESGYLWEVKNSDGSQPDLSYLSATDNTIYIDTPIDEEPKLSDNIHHKDNRYRWGGVGAENVSLAYKKYYDEMLSIPVTIPKDTTGYDDWNSLVNGSNSEKLCGKSNWKVPSNRELKTLKDRDIISLEKYLNIAYSFDEAYNGDIGQHIKVFSPYSSSSTETYVYTNTGEYYIKNNGYRTGNKNDPDILSGPFGYYNVTISLLPPAESFIEGFDAQMNLPFYVQWESKESAYRGLIGLSSREHFCLGAKARHINLVSPINSKEDGHIDAGADIEKNYGDDPFTRTPTVGYGQTENTYNSTQTNVATVNRNGKVTIHNAGLTTITIRNSGNDFRSASYDSYNLLVKKIAQEISAGGDFYSNIDTNITQYQITPSAYSGDGDISYYSSDPSVATVTNLGLVKFINPGTTIITVTIAESSNYLQASDTFGVILTSNP